ncbi:hypothetical protein [Prevotella jejuni]|nr:hypothetical protein [Prevotella jejuni]QUB81861.1 hypothetical protein J5A63_12950 [Prevotella jejuni]
MVDYNEDYESFEDEEELNDYNEDEILDIMFDRDESDFNDDDDGVGQFLD